MHNVKVLMLLDDLSKQWMYEYAQAARRKLDKCATPWDVMISCAAGCAAGTCYKQCMLIDREVNCVHRKHCMRALVNLTHDDAVKSE